MKKLKYLLLSFLLLPAMFAVTACASDDENASGKQVPVYIGMEVSSTETTTNSASVSAATADGGYDTPQEYLGDHYEHWDYEDHHYHGDFHGRDEWLDQDHPFAGDTDEEGDETPEIEDVIEDECTLEYVGTDQKRYYSEPEEDVLVKIYFSNPDNYVILSFDLNGERYASYMFQDGSTMECIILKVNVGEKSGLFDFTIDQIKYVDGSQTKDVLIDGDQTVSIAVTGDGVTYAKVSNEEIGLTSISFDVTLRDEYGLIEDANGFARAYLYDGETLIDSCELSIGKNSVKFENLQSNKVYQYAVVGYFDDLSGDGEMLHIFTKKAFYTQTIVLFDEIDVSYTSVSYSYNWNEGMTNTTISETIFDANDLTTPLEIFSTEEDETRTISNLLTNHEYVIVAEYKNAYNQTEFIHLSVQTLEHQTPTMEIANVLAGQENVTFEIEITDSDSVGALTSISLAHGDDTTTLTGDELVAREFDELLSDNEYSIEVVYTYNLNDGTGDHSITKSYDFTTEAKATPVVEIANILAGQENVAFEIEITDADSVGALTSISLTHGDDITTLTGADLTAREFDKLLSNNEYSIVVVYTYNLNDGTGDHTIAQTYNFTTEAKATPVVEIANVLAGQEDVAFEIEISDPDGVGALTSVSLTHGEDTTTLTGDELAAREFDKLLSNNGYSIEVVYTYNLNDGTGDHSITKSYDFTTEAKATPIVEIADVLAGQEKVTFEIEITDSDSVGALTSISLAHGDDTITLTGDELAAREFDKLLSDNGYSIEVVYTYNLNDGTGDHTITKTYNFITEAKATPVVEIANVLAGQENVTFEIEITDADSVGALTSISLTHGDDTTTLTGADLTAREFDELLSDNKYSIEVVYTYDLNDGTGDHTITKTYNFITEAKATPVVEIANVVAGQENVTFEIEITDADSVGALTSISLTHGDDITTLTGADLTAREFDKLLSNNGYSIEVVYTYDLNDGTGDHTITKTCNFTTEAKATPTMEIEITAKTATSITASATLTDVDKVATVTGIKLLNGEIVAKTFESIADLSASDLTGGETYEYVIEYEFNLNDGNGLHTEKFTYQFIAQKDILANSTLITNTRAVSLDDTVYVVFTTPAYDVTYNSVKINGTYFDVVESQSTSNGTKVYVDVTIDETYLGGDTTFEIEEILVTEGTEQVKYPVSGKTTATLFVNGTISVDEVELMIYENGTFVSADYCMPSDDVYLYVTLTNKTGYSIDSATISGTTYTDIVTIDDDHFAVKMSLSTGYITKNLTQISYSNEDVTKEYTTSLSSSMYKVKSDEVKYITTANDLLDMDDGYYYELANDIDLSGTEWSNAGTFNGVFNGNGHSIKNMAFNTTLTLNSTTYVGLFSKITNGVIFNLSIEDVSFRLTVTSVEDATCELYVGGLAGYVNRGNVIVRGVSVSGLISVSHDNDVYAGGLIGCFDSYSSSNVNRIFISECSSSAIVNITSKSGSIYAGGLIGYNESYNNSTFVIEDCYATGNVTATTENGAAYVGGLVGENYWRYSNVTITNCYATGNVSAKSGTSDVYAGGLFGEHYSSNSSTITRDCYSTGTVTATSESGDIKAGGLTGYLGSFLSLFNCYSTGNVTAISESGYINAGGLVGRFGYSSSLSDCYSTGDVVAETTNNYAFAGGLVGYAASSGTSLSITACYSTGNVIAKASNSMTGAGGLLGYFTGSDGMVVSNCFACGNVSTESSTSSAYLGALIGYSNDTITVENSYVSEDQVFSLTKNGTTSSTPSNTYGTATAVENLQSETWLTETLGWGKYVSEADLAENENNVWVFAEGEYPKLFFQA